MTRDQIKKVSKEGARKAADPKGGKPASPKHVRRLAELKQKRAKGSVAPAEYPERKRA